MKAFVSILILIALCLVVLSATRGGHKLTDRFTTAVQAVE